MKKVYVIVGTRPDTIKMAPIYHALRNKSEVSTKLISTGQHKELMATALNTFNLQPDIDLALMNRSPSLLTLTANILQGLESVFHQEKPDLVLTHGDTTTGYAASLACFYNAIPFYHVEAGLRSHHMLSPYPEEFHRQSIAMIATHHFAPSNRERQNLLKEGVKESAITITGSTAHEAIQSIDYHNDGYFQYIRNGQFTKVVTVTMHRRENGNGHLQSMMNAIKNVALKEKECVFIFPVHPNPLVQKVSGDIFQNVNNVVLTKPLEYKKFISLLTHSDLILTDSGGVQEEAAFLGRKVFILRDHSERFDGMKHGFTKIVGVNADTIECEVLSYLQNRNKDSEPSAHPILASKMPSSIIADYIVGASS